MKSKIQNKLILFYNRLIIKMVSLISKFIIKLKLKSILEKNFKKNKPFLFVQIGANDGVSFDFLYDFIIERDASGFVVEPIKEYFDELLQNYEKFEKIIKVNKAVHQTEKMMSIYKIKQDSKDKYPDWVKGIASFNPQHHLKLNIDSQDIISEIVACDSLMNIVSLKNIDYFQIDTEGFDYEILKMIDFEILNPKIVKFEHVNLSNEDKINSKKLLKSKGYYVFNEANDTIAINLNQIQL